MSEPGEQASAPGERSLRLILWLTPAFGLAAGLGAALLHRWDWAKGLILGSALAWLNFRWLKRGLQAFFAASTAQASGDEKPRVAAVYLAAAFRYGLIGLAVYVIFSYLHVPLVSIVAGLCALGAATIAATLWEVLNPLE